MLGTYYATSLMLAAIFVIVMWLVWVDPLDPSQPYPDRRRRRVASIITLLAPGGCVLLLPAMILVGAWYAARGAYLVTYWALRLDEEK